TLDKYELPYPEVGYFCSWILAKKLLRLPSYRLDQIASYYKIRFHHHQASDDAKVCAEIVRNMLNEAHIEDLDQMQKTIKYRLGRLHKNSYSPFSSHTYRNTQSFKPSQIIASRTSFDEHHPLYHQVVVFTGVLTSLSREDACRKVVNCGGINGNNVTKQTTILVVGEPDSRTPSNKNSTKEQKAKKLVAQGQTIKIVTENDFIKLFETNRTQAE
ncbi:MAG: hypothetical protein K0Q87_5139, partial [Neobacillus sp.]|nr:hypothetical protein [Neobacillus sp.]